VPSAPPWYVEGTLGAQAAVRSAASAEREPYMTVRVRRSVAPRRVVAEPGLAATAPARVVDEQPSIRFFFPGKDTGTIGRLSYPIFPGGTALLQLGPLSTGHPSGVHRELVGEASQIRTNFRTTTGGVVTLTWLPGSTVGYQYDPVEDAYYPVLEGDFTLGPTNALLMCGLSGIEYFEIGTSSRMRFVPSQPAFAPAFNTDTALYVPKPLVSTGAGKTGITTCYAFVYDAQASLNYCSEPIRAPFYGAGRSPGFLEFKPMSFAALQAPGDPNASFPMVPYGGLEGEDLANAAAFERQLLSPIRTATIARYVHDTPRVGPTGATGATGPPPGPTGPALTTTRGIVVVPGPTANYWDALQVAQSNGGAQKVEFRAVEDSFRRGLLTNQTFLVISSKEKFVKNYDFAQAVLNISGWNFELLPDTWATHSTIAIFKFAEGSLLSLAQDLGSWTSADDFNDVPFGVQQRLLSILNASTTGPNFANFNSIIRDPNWSGVLFLNAFVPLKALPPQLEGLAAGIDASKFFAHHLGVNLSPVHVSGETMTMADSSLFGLISYEDPIDLVDNGDAYQFKVLLLQVLFENSSIATFSSQIELFIGELFGEQASRTSADVTDSSTPATGERDGLIKLNGAYQRNLDGASSRDAYQFTWRGAQTYYVASKVAEQVTFNQAEFVTVVGTAGSPGPVVSRFLFWGDMGFRSLNFDVFAFDHLAFSNLAIQMQFPASDPTQRTFAFDAGHVALDATSGVVRNGSVPANFPLDVVGMIQGGSDTAAGEALSPAAAGFMSVQSPLPQSSIGATWWGLTYSLNLGSPGALAAQAGFDATLLAAWGAPDGGTAKTFIGLRLPGSSGSSPELTIEGPLKLAMSSIQFAAAQGGGRPYVLRFNDIALKFLSLSLPRGGTTNVFLFGDPAGTSSKTLGWYGAYKKDPPKQDDSNSSVPPLARPAIEIEPRAATGDGTTDG
jgi:hypothetical protein